MGYTTDFEGLFSFDKALSPEKTSYLVKFAETRRMKRDADKAASLPDETRKLAGLDIGPEGAYFVGAGGHSGQDHDDSVKDYNCPPKGQPGLWCQWVPVMAPSLPSTYELEDGTSTGLQWDGNEKFYDYVEWLEYLIENFLKPWGIKVNGEVQWFGEERDDIGNIVVIDNVVTVEYGRIVYG